MAATGVSKLLITALLSALAAMPALSGADELLSAQTTTAQQPRQEQGGPPATPSRAASSSPPAGRLQNVGFDAAYFRGYGTDFVNMITSPARWDSSDWITAGAVIGASAALYQNDAKILQWISEHKTSTASDIGEDTTDFGHGKFTPVILGGMYVYGYAADDARMRTSVLLSVESFVLTGVFVQTLKYATNRHRPYTKDPPHTWDGPGTGGSSDTMSFPSGHASSAFAVASVFASVYDNAWVPPLVYTIASLTAANRLLHNAHWPSDVFVGSSIGYFTGKAIVSYHRVAGTSGMQIVPLLSAESRGIMLVSHF